MNAPYVTRDGPVLESPDHELWIRSTDNVHRTADDLIAELLGRDWIDMACIGAACINQGMKALAVAREKVRGAGLDLVAQPFFSTIEDDQQRTRTRLMVRVTKVRL